MVFGQTYALLSHMHEMLRVLAALRSTHDGKLQPWSVHKGPAKVLHCGVVLKEDWGKLVSAIDRVRTKAVKERGKGLPRTPDTVARLTKAAAKMVSVACFAVFSRRLGNIAC